MTAVIPYSLAFALLISAVMQRSAVSSLNRAKLHREARFSLYASYACFCTAAAAFIAGAVL